MIAVEDFLDIFRISRDCFHWCLQQTWTKQGIGGGNIVDSTEGTKNILNTGGVTMLPDKQSENDAEMYVKLAVQSDSWMLTNCWRIEKSKEATYHAVNLVQRFENKVSKKLSGGACHQTSLEACP